MIQDYLRHLKYSNNSKGLFLVACLILAAIAIIVLFAVGYLGCDPVSVMDYFACVVGVAAAGVCAKI